MSVRTQRNSLPLLHLNFKVPQYSDYYFRDDFDDTIRDPLWTDDPNSGTITEIDEVLTLAIANGVHGDFWPGIGDDGPVCWIDSTVQHLTVTAKLNSYTVNDRTRAGIYITDVITGANGIHFGRVKNTVTPEDGLAVTEMGVGALARVAVTTLPVWLRATINGSGAGSTMVFEYSHNGTNWTYVYTVEDETWDKVGLLAFNWAIWSAISAPFEFFMLENYTEKETLAPIDTRAPNVFYDGRIKQMSSLKRAIDDKTGLFQIADMNITLANADKHYSQKMASRILKNQQATLYHAWTEEAESEKLHVIKLIVDDHSMKGPDFIVNLKDITQKYFMKKVPENICTKDDYPNMSDEHIGWCKPEILGRAYLPTGYEHEGAVEAVYVDTTIGRFIAAARPLYDITEVYLDDILQTEGVAPGNWQWWATATDTFIRFHDTGAPPHYPTTDQVVSFNAEGYTALIWNSGNGYIQNLAYIIQYFLRFIMGIPAELVDSASFTTLAGYYEEMGVDEGCYLVLQDRVDGMELLRQLLFTGGAKGFMALDGRFNVERKDICTWQIEAGHEIARHLFEQIDLFAPPEGSGICRMQ